jgi:hypothetical protein
MRSRLLHALVLALVLALGLAFTAFAAAADQPQHDELPDASRDLDTLQPKAADPGEEWWRDVIHRFPTCSSLTDGCQACARNGETLTCSTPAIACVRGEWRCASEQEKD